MVQWDAERSSQSVPETFGVGARVRLSSLRVDSSPPGDSTAVRAQGTHWDVSTAS